MKKNFLQKLKPIQIIALGFAFIILTGTLLLMLPISTAGGGSASFFDSLFTATSATCVTGLVVQDTGTYWSGFGQIIILLMIQIGGLGFMTFATMFAVIMRRKIGLKERGLIQESVNTLQIGGVVKLTKKIVIGTFLIEGCGALLLSIRFIPLFGFGRGAYYSIFHSISAFCNAGFDLMGREYGKYCSFVNFDSDIMVNVTLMLLILIGGLGFIVWNDITDNGLHFKKYMVHTKIVLVTTLGLTFGGALLFWLFEHNGIFAAADAPTSILSSFFQSVTTRTAGFNTIDLNQLSPDSKLLTIAYMFIGGSPGSTAGGIKTTTLIVMLLCIRSTFKNTREMNIFDRRLEPDVARRAFSVVFTNFSLAIAAAIIICANQDISLGSVLIETFSAIGTVGMSCGITRDFTLVSRLAIIVLMYCGRVGSLSFVLSFSSVKQSSTVLPETKITIG